jgi:hypothetical protein
LGAKHPAEKGPDEGNHVAVVEWEYDIKRKPACETEAIESSQFTVSEPRGLTDEIEFVGGIAFMKNDKAFGKLGVLGTASDEREMFLRTNQKRRVLFDNVLKRVNHVHPPDGVLLAEPSASRMAQASSVISIPTGHQVMQRPQPTHPEVPNWSIQ